MRRPELLLISLSLFVASLASADSLGGIWKGKVHRHFVYQTRAHEAIYSEDLDLTLLVGDEVVSGHGTAHLSDPIISRPRFDKRYSQWTTSYDPHDIGLSVQGQRTGEGHWLALTFTPIASVKAHIHYQDLDGSTNIPLDVPVLLSQTIPWTTTTAGHFLRHLSLSGKETSELPVDVAYVGEQVLGAVLDAEGGFHQIAIPGRKLSSAILLAALVAFILLVSPGMVQRPDSSRLAAILGTLLGTLVTLQGLGLGETTHVARVFGWAIFLLVEILELRRLYKRRCPTFRLVSSVAIDVASLAAGFWLMSKAIDTALTSAAGIGHTPAIAAAVVAAACITYGVSYAAGRGKTWASKN